jgi:hypothetical protein
MAPPKRPRLRHISVRARVSVNEERWQETQGPEDLEEGVRQYVIHLINTSPARQDGAIVGARRDQR